MDGDEVIVEEDGDWEELENEENDKSSNEEEDDEDEAGQKVGYYNYDDEVEKTPGSRSSICEDTGEEETHKGIVSSKSPDNDYGYGSLDEDKDIFNLSPRPKSSKSKKTRFRPQDNDDDDINSSTKYQKIIEMTSDAIRLRKAEKEKALHDLEKFKNSELDKQRRETQAKKKEEERLLLKKLRSQATEAPSFLLRGSGWTTSFEEVNKIRSKEAKNLPKPQLLSHAHLQPVPIFLHGKERTNIHSVHHRYTPCPAQNAEMSAKEKYSKVGDYHCIWCTEPFHGTPFPCVGSWSQVQEIFYVYGNFCSPECSNAFIFEEKGAKAGMQNNLMFFLVYGLHIADQKRAPPRFCLKKFEGYLDIAAFRSKCNNNIKFQVLEPPFSNHHLGIMELEKIVTETVRVYDTGFEEVVAKNSRYPSHSIAPTQIVTAPQGFKMQRGSFSQMPTLEEQIVLAQKSASALRIARAQTTVKKTKNLRDFMVKKPI